jgi:hypothetical protein
MSIVIVRNVHVRGRVIRCFHEMNLARALETARERGLLVVECVHVRECRSFLATTLLSTANFSVFAALEAALARPMLADWQVVALVADAGSAVRYRLVEVSASGAFEAVVAFYSSLNVSEFIALLVRSE